MDFAVGLVTVWRCVGANTVKFQKTGHDLNIANSRNATQN